MSSMPNGERFDRVQPSLTPVTQGPINKTEQSYENTLTLIRNYIPHALAARQYPGQFAVLGYEDFVDNYDIIFTGLEFVLGITTSPDERARITAKVNREAVLKIQQGLPDFSQYDTESWIHGQHIHDGSTGRWKRDIPPERQAELQELLKPCLEAYGYES
jgi:hypothetical protein